MTTYKLIRAAACCLALLLAGGTVRAEVSATVTQSEVTTEQSLSLTVTTTSANGAPDMAILSNDFEVLRQSSQSQMQMTGDQVQQTRSWIVELLPKRQGALVIPSFSIDGETTNPIEITVTSPEAVVPGGDLGDFYVEVSVDNEEPYVQSQVVFTIKVFYAVNLLEGNLSSPESEAVVIERLGEDKQFRENRNGRQYRVLERKFAVFPQKSGEIRLPQIVLNAEIPADGSRVRGFFTPTKQIRRGSTPVTLNVKPRPDASVDGWWLPAKSVFLQGRWEGDTGEIRVGDSLTRSVMLVAEGVDSTQLPEIAVPQNPGFKVYADQPKLGKQPSVDGLQSSRIEKWAIVAQQAGTLTLPEVRVPWFNTATQTEEVAVLPAASLEILPAESAPAASTGIESEPSDMGVDTTAQTDAAVPRDPAADNAASMLTPDGLVDNRSDGSLDPSTGGGRPWWKWYALAATIAWLITAGVLVRLLLQGRKLASSTAHANVGKTAVGASLKDVRKACQSGDLKQCAAAIVRWARQHWPENPPGTLGAVAARLDSPALADDLASLDSALYANRPQAVSLDTLAERLKEAVSLPVHKSRTNRTADLPEL